MRSIFRATALLGSSSAVTILVGLVSVKVWALLVGPSGVGLMGLLQSLIGLASLIAGMGVATGLVRMGADAIAKEDDLRQFALRRAAWLLFWSLGGLAALALVLFRTPISSLMLGGPEHATSVVLMGLALLFTLAAGLQTGTLNAHHRVAALAKLGAISSVLAAALGIGLVWLWGEGGIAPALIFGSAVSWLVSRLFLMRELGGPASPAPRSQILVATRDLLRFGAPYTLSMLVGFGMQFVVPVLVLHHLGQDSVGYYRAAFAVSVTYLGFLLTAMAQDYFPRLSAVQGDDKLSEVVNQQHRLIMLIGVPMILGMLAAAPYLIPLIYSAEFQPAVEIVEWQLVGDILKFSSWTMSFVILTRSGSMVFFFTEAVAGITRLSTSWLGLQWFGLAGLGMSHLAVYAVYFVVVWIVVRKRTGLYLSAENRIMLGLALAAGFFILSLPLLNLTHVRLPVALSLTLLIGAGSLYRIRHDLAGDAYRAG